MCSVDGIISIHDLKSSELLRPLRQLRGHADRVTSIEVTSEVSHLNLLHMIVVIVAWQLGDDVVHSCSRDGTIRVWHTGLNSSVNITPTVININRMPLSNSMEASSVRCLLFSCYTSNSWC